MTLAPLEDPSYDPVHKPINGRIPDVVLRWGPRSQVRWWRRFGNTVREQYNALPLHERQAHPLNSHLYYCDSEHHLGPCCYSCFEEAHYYGTGVLLDGWCCCRDRRNRTGY